jgi:hypothetical protein
MPCIPFFLEPAREMHIISLREKMHEMGSKNLISTKTQHTLTHTKKHSKHTQITDQARNKQVARRTTHGWGLSAENDLTKNLCSPLAPAKHHKTHSVLYH